MYQPPASSFNPAVAATTIDPTDWIALLADLVAALSASIAVDGQTTITANLPMSTFKFTGLGNGSAATDSAALGQVQSGLVGWIASGGTVSAITATYAPAITALTDGMVLAFRATGANTSTTPTFSPNGLTARTIVKSGGVALAVNDIPRANYECLVRYYAASTRWELLNPCPAPGIQSGTTAAATATATTIYTISGTSGAYIVYVNLLGGNDITNYGAWAIIVHDTAGVSLRLTGTNGALMTITSDGGTLIKATQSSGAPQTIEWSVFKISV